MSLKIWYPLIDDLENRGLDDTPLTVHGSVPFEKARVRTAPSFNGVVGNNLTRPVFLTKDNNFSVSLWIKRADTTTAYVLYQENTGVANEFSVTNGTTVSFRYVNNAFNFGNLELNKWYHIAITIDDNKIVRGFVDGSLVFTSSSAITFTPNEGSFYFGGVGTVYFNGQTQDFRYYDHCLSAKEVKELSQGLCLHLKCDGIGAGENMLKNSAIMFNSVGGVPMSVPTGATVTKTLETDETAPCGANGKVLHVQVRKKDGADFNAFTSGAYWDSTLDLYQPPLTVGDIYCLTAYVKGTGASVYLPPLAEGQTTISSKNIKAFTDEWQRTYYIFRAVAPASDPSATTVKPVLTCYFRVPASTECDVYYCCPKIEKLTSSPYIPNLVDSQYSQYLPTQEDDCSGLGFNANYINMTASDVAINNGNARYNTSLDFTKADSQCLLGEKTPFTSETKNFTISAWVKFKTVETQAIFSSRTGTGVGVALFFLGNNTFRLDDGVAILTVFSSTSITANTWYHVVATRTETEKKLYINGELKATKTDTQDMSGISDRYSIGASETSSILFGNYANANISDFRIYATALSATDIKALYETSASIDNEGNLHTYELDEGFTLPFIQKTGIFNSPSIQEIDKSAKIKQDEVDVNKLNET